MEIHELLRKFRKERGLSQKELAHKITSRESLVKYESGKNQIPLIPLLAFLKKMNIELDECLFYLNKINGNHPRQKLNQLLSQLEDVQLPIDDRLRNLELDIKKTKSIVDKRNYLIAKGYQWHLLPNDERKFTLHDKVYIKAIMNHLEKVAEYGRFEIVTFTSLAFLFTTEFIQMQASKVERMGDNENFLSSLCTLYHVLFLLMLERKESGYSKEYIEKLKMVRGRLVTPQKTEVHERLDDLLLNSLVERTANPKQLTDFFMGIRLIGATQLEEEFLLALKKYERLYGLSLLPSIIE